LLTLICLIRTEFFRATKTELYFTLISLKVRKWPANNHRKLKMNLKLEANLGRLNNLIIKF